MGGCLYRSPTPCRREASSEGGRLVIVIVAVRVAHSLTGELQSYAYTKKSERAPHRGE